MEKPTYHRHKEDEGNAEVLEMNTVSKKLTVNGKTATCLYGRVWHFRAVPKNNGVEILCSSASDEDGNKITRREDSVLFSSYENAVSGNGFGHGQITGFAADCAAVFAAEFLRS